ncbi:MAG: hypothetical protein JXR78_01810 [Victivallales bacterium]|nr:hypothetical protein [Victivallales bacterium]
MKLMEMHNHVISAEKIVQEKHNEIMELKRMVRNLEWCNKELLEELRRLRSRKTLIGWIKGLIGKGK